MQQLGSRGLWFIPKGKRKDGNILNGVQGRFKFTTGNQFMWEGIPVKNRGMLRIQRINWHDFVRREHSGEPKFVHHPVLCLLYGVSRVVKLSHALLFLYFFSPRSIFSCFPPSAVRIQAERIIPRFYESPSKAASFHWKLWYMMFLVWQGSFR